MFIFRGKIPVVLTIKRFLDFAGNDKSD